jgi:hypothetical protein
MHERTDRIPDRNAASPEAGSEQADPRHEPDERTRPQRALAGSPADVRAPFPDRVDDASDDSFPASDAPSWTGLRIGSPRSDD